MNIFKKTEILLPKTLDMEKWSVIACDQFTSQPEYWNRVKNNVDGAISTLDLILPEVELENLTDERIAQINAAMADYLNRNVFSAYQNAYIYVERTLLNGSIRKGMVGAVDLEAYDYTLGATAAVRATEKTVVERIPPRKRIRENAPIELPHVLLLCDDAEKRLIESITEIKDSLPKLYDFDLMENGGHIAGWLVQGEVADSFDQKLDEYAAGAPDRYRDLDGTPLLFAVGDGNHSLATAKACYEAMKSKVSDDLSEHPARYALVELGNIHDDSLEFEPIHRIVKNTDPEAMLNAMHEKLGEGDYPIDWVAGDRKGTVMLDLKSGELPVGVLQAFWDDYLKTHSGTIDYIHGDDTVRALASDCDSIGFLLPAMEKGDLFRGIVAGGVLPRKTFSMGHAEEKRYYLEARKIK